MPEGHAGQARAGLGQAEGVANRLWLFNQRQQHDRARLTPGPFLGQRDQLIDKPDALDRIGLGHDQPVRPGLDHGQHVIQKVRRIKVIDPHRPLKARKAAVAQHVFERLTGNGFALRGDGVFEIEDQAISLGTLGFGKKPLATGRDKQQTTAETRHGTPLPLDGALKSLPTPSARPDARASDPIRHSRSLRCGCPCGSDRSSGLRPASGSGLAPRFAF